MGRHQIPIRITVKWLIEYSQKKEGAIPLNTSFIIIYILRERIIVMHSNPHEFESNRSDSDSIHPAEFESNPNWGARGFELYRVDSHPVRIRLESDSCGALPFSLEHST